VTFPAFSHSIFAVFNLKTNNFINASQLTKGIIMNQSDAVFTQQNGDEEIKCPACNSLHIETRNIGQRTGRTIGTAAGSVAGVAGVISGAETGAAIGMAAGPIGIAAGGLFGALLGGLIGAAVGGTAGSKIGRMADENLLENYQCQACGHTFGNQDL
jgi:DNA-directed RNA polymerase subunit M/transcription elongation factor TFIIS